MRGFNRHRARRIVEYAFIVIGLGLLGIFGLAHLHSSIGSASAIHAFEVSQEAQLDPAVDASVDFSLWSPKRIKAYLDSLTLMKDTPMAVLALDRLQIKAAVFAGTDDLALNRGLGWIPGTAKPGEAGNIGIAGHRDGFFRALKDSAIGDVIQLKSDQKLSTYRITSFETVTPDNVSVLRPTDAATLTLVTCFPFYFVGDAPQRFIVHAKLDEKSSSQFQNSSPGSARAAGQFNKE